MPFTCAIEASSRQGAYCWGGYGVWVIRVGSWDYLGRVVSTSASEGRSVTHVCLSDARRPARGTRAGSNNYGKLGINTVDMNVFVSVPVAVDPPAAVTAGWSAISAGFDHACALTADWNAAAYCWGGCCCI